MNAGNLVALAIGIIIALLVLGSIVPMVQQKIEALGSAPVVLPILNFLPTVLMIIVILMPIVLILKMLSADGWESSGSDWPRDTEPAPYTPPSRTVKVCAYCRGRIGGSELNCPHCDAPLIALEREVPA